MIISGLIGYGEIHIDIVNLIYTILNSYKKKVSVLDCKSIKEINTLKSYIFEIKKNNSDFLLLRIDPNNFNSKLFDLQLLDYLQLDIILYNNETDPIYGWNMCKFSDPIKKLLPFLKEKSTIILNEDFLFESSFTEKYKHKIVTYGFNSKAEVTTSSIIDTLFGKEFVFYQQKKIQSINNKIISPQEYRININKANVDIYTILSAVTFALVAGINISHSFPLNTLINNTNIDIISERTIY